MNVSSLLSNCVVRYANDQAKNTTYLLLLLTDKEHRHNVNVKCVDLNGRNVKYNVICKPYAVRWRNGARILCVRMTSRIFIMCHVKCSLNGESIDNVKILF